MKGEQALFSKESDNWKTPPDLFAALQREFGFDLDAAADAASALCKHWLGPGSPLAEDALSVPSWGGWGHKMIFCNPPYSQVRGFVAKAREAGGQAVVLVPARTDTRWWHDYVWETNNYRPRPRTEIRFLKGRLKFSGSSNSAPFPSVLLVLR